MAEDTTWRATALWGTEPGWDWTIDKTFSVLTCSNEKDWVNRGRLTGWAKHTKASAKNVFKTAAPTDAEHKAIKTCVFVSTGDPAHPNPFLLPLAGYVGARPVQPALGPQGSVTNSMTFEYLNQNKKLRTPARFQAHLNAMVAASKRDAGANNDDDSESDASRKTNGSGSDDASSSDTDDEEPKSKKQKTGGGGGAGGGTWSRGDSSGSLQPGGTDAKPGSVSAVQQTLTFGSSSSSSRSSPSPLPSSVAKVARDKDYDSYSEDTCSEDGEESTVATKNSARTPSAQDRADRSESSSSKKRKRKDKDKPKKTKSKKAKKPKSSHSQSAISAALVAGSLSIVGSGKASRKTRVDPSDLERDRKIALARQFEKKVFDIQLQAKYFKTNFTPPAGTQRTFKPKKAEKIAEAIRGSKAPLERDVVSFAVDWRTLPANERSAETFQFRGVGAPGVSDENYTRFFPYKGQHTAHAYYINALKYPKESVANGYFTVGVLLYDSHSDADIVSLTLLGQMDNKKNEIRDSESFIDTVERTHATCVATCQARHAVYDGSASLSVSEVRHIKSTCLETGKASDAWRIIGLPNNLYNLVLPLFKGEAISVRDRKVIKAPGSGSHFAHIGFIDFSVLETFFKKLVQGTWTGQVFLDKTKQFKRILILRKAIVKYLVTTGKITVQEVSDTGEFSLAAVKKGPAGEEVDPVAGLKFCWEFLSEKYPDLDACVSHYVTAEFKVDLFVDLELTGAMKASIDAATTRAAQTNTALKDASNVKRHEFAIGTRKLIAYHCDAGQVAKVVPKEKIVAVFADLPYTPAESSKPTTEPQDVSWSVADLKKVLDQAVAVTTADSPCIILKHALRHTNEYNEVLQQRQLKTTPCVYTTANKNQSGVNHFIDCNEYFTVGTPRGHQFHFDASIPSTHRHNILVGTACSSKRLDGDGQVVNPAQTPTYFCQEVLKQVLGSSPAPDDAVLILCGGTGSDGIGALAAGFNVHIVEKDDYQYEQMIVRLTGLQDTCCTNSENTPAEALQDVVRSEGFGAFGVVNYMQRLEERAKAAEEAKGDKTAKKDKAGGASIKQGKEAASKEEKEPEHLLKCFDCNADAKGEPLCEDCQGVVCPKCIFILSADEGAGTVHKSRKCLQMEAE